MGEVNLIVLGWIQIRYSRGKGVSSNFTQVIPS